MRISPKFPFDPAKLGFFYGWPIVLLATLGVAMSMPGQTAGISAFTDSLIDVTGLSRLSLANAYLIGTVASGFILPFGGRLLDHFGAREIAALACLGLGGALLYLAFCDILINFTGQALIVMCLGFFLVRFFGQGMLTMVSRTMLGKWFDKKRGLATGIHSVAVALTFGMAPAILGDLVSSLGWRQTWQASALASGLGMALIAFVFFRDRPEDVGLEMDGAITKSSDSGSLEAKLVEGLSWREAIATLRFHVVALAVSAQALIITGLTFHIADIGRTLSMADGKSATIFIPLSYVATATSLFISIASDYFAIRWVVIIMAIGQACGMFGLAYADQEAFFWLSAFGLGLSGGCFATLATISMPRFFGRKDLGTINSLVTMAMVVGSALGPIGFALSASFTGSYTNAFLLTLVFPILMISASFAMRE